MISLSNKLIIRRDWRKIKDAKRVKRSFLGSMSKANIFLSKAIKSIDFYFCKNCWISLSNFWSDLNLPTFINKSKNSRRRNCSYCVDCESAFFVGWPKIFFEDGKCALVENFSIEIFIGSFLSVDCYSCMKFSKGSLIIIPAAWSSFKSSTASAISLRQISGGKQILFRYVLTFFLLTSMSLARYIWWSF